MLYNSNFSHSEFVLFIKNNTVYVSTFILNELYIVANRNTIYCNVADIERFVMAVGFRVYWSVKLPIDKYIEYVLDDMDVQILKDAVELNATHILTNNLKDFHNDQIKKDFWILVISNLDDL